MTIKDNIEQVMDSVTVKVTGMAAAGSMWTDLLDDTTKVLGAIYLTVLIIYYSHKTWINHVNNKKP